MKARVIKIGNSRGIRLPKTIIEELQLGEEVLLEASHGSLVISPASAPRAGWEAAFREMARRQEDKLVDADSTPTVWDREEWEWK